MKIWIVGPQGTSKCEIARLLADDKFKVAKLFSGLSEDELTYHKDMYKSYNNDIIKSIFENGAYVFINDVFEKVEIQEGLEFDEFDNNDVFVLSIDQFISVNTKYISKNDLIVWLDGTRKWRMMNCDKDYNKFAREDFETACYSTFGNMINNFKTSHKNVIYFYEEIPERVKTIIKVIANNPKLKEEFVKNFNPNI